VHYRDDVRSQRGDLLLESLFAFALVALLALGTVGLAHAAVRLSAEARDLDRALSVLRGCLAETELVGWHRLAEYFGPDATIDTATDAAPASWLARVQGWPGARVVGRLEPLGSGPIAWRVVIEIEFGTAPRRTLQLIQVRS
jgi:Tfp pilus assembly protein PilX